MYVENSEQLWFNQINFSNNTIITQTKQVNYNQDGANMFTFKQLKIIRINNFII